MQTFKDSLPLAKDKLLEKIMQPYALNDNIKMADFTSQPSIEGFNWKAISTLTDS
jgi:hypothetical protein